MHSFLCTLEKITSYIFNSSLSFLSIQCFGRKESFAACRKNMERGDGMRKQRESNIELLRIVSAILIILHHYMTSIEYFGSQSMLNRFFYVGFGEWGGIGVDLFIMISAWFFCERDARFSINQLFRLSMTVILYSFIWYVILVAIGDLPLTPKWLLKMFLSPILGSYWFVVAYIIFYMLCPYLNIFVNCLSDAQMKRVVYGLFLVVAMYHTVFGGETALLGIISTFVFIFILTAYLKRRPGNMIERHCAMITVIDYLLIVIVSFLLSETGHSEYIGVFADRGCVFILVLCVSVFYLFRRLTFHNNFVNHIAGSVFGVYILHQFWWGHHYIWEIAGVEEAYKTYLFFAHMILTTTAIFAIGTCIDLMRRRIENVLERTTIHKVIMLKMEQIDEKIIVKG